MGVKSRIVAAHHRTGERPIMKIHAHTFAAVAQLMSTEQIRYYICGVCVEPGGTLIATDGHGMIVAHRSDSVDLPAQNIIVTPDKALLTAAKKKNAAMIDFDRLIDGPAQVLDADGVVIGLGMARQVDGTFPEWRRVAAEAAKYDTPSDTPAAFSTKLLSQMGDVAKIATQTKEPPVQIIAQHDEPSPVRFPGTSHIAGVVMPMRLGQLGTSTSLTSLI